MLCLAGATLWCLPLLASGLLALLRYGFGSLFVVGESAAAALLRSGGADIAGAIGRLAADPALSAAEAGGGLVLAAAAAALVMQRPRTASLLALGSAAEALWYGLPFAAAMLFPAAICAIATVRG